MTRFRTDMVERCTSRSNFYSPLLHNALIALAHVFPSPYGLTTDSSISLGDSFAARAVECIADELERPMLSGVQGLMLLSTYNSANGRMNTGYAYFGMAMRMADSRELAHFA